MLILRKDRIKKLKATHGHNINTIGKEYWELTNYKIVYEDKEEIKSKYKYHVKDLAKKYKVSTYELIFLSTLSGEYMGVCDFCLMDKYKYFIRSNKDTASFTCDCVSSCKLCHEPMSLVGDGICYKCKPSPEWREDYNEDEQLNYHQNKLNNLLENFKNVFFNLDYAYECQPSYEIQWVVWFLENALESIKKLG